METSMKKTMETGVGKCPFLGIGFTSPNQKSVGNYIPFLAGWCETNWDIETNPGETPAISSVFGIAHGYGNLHEKKHGKPHWNGFRKPIPWMASARRELAVQILSEVEDHCQGARDLMPRIPLQKDVQRGAKGIQKGKMAAWDSLKVFWILDNWDRWDSFWDLIFWKWDWDKMFHIFNI